MGLFDFLLPGLSAVTGALGEKAKKTTQTSAPVIDPTTQPLRTSIINNANTLLTTDPDLSGYKATQTQGINSNSNIQQEKIKEDAALHGVTGPALDAALDNADSQRFGQITNLNEQIPLEQNQLRTQNLGAAAQAFGAIPRGTTGTTQSNGNVLGGFVSGLSQMIAQMHGMGAFGKPKAPTSNGSGGTTPIALPDGF